LALAPSHSASRKPILSEGSSGDALKFSDEEVPSGGGSLHGRFGLGDLPFEVLVVRLRALKSIPTLLTPVNPVTKLTKTPIVMF
jgi:hypothetical protein